MVWQVIFCGVLIFIIFVVKSAVTKINAYRYAHMHKHSGTAVGVADRMASQWSYNLASVKRRGNENGSGASLSLLSTSWQYHWLQGPSIPYDCSERPRWTNLQRSEACRRWPGRKLPDKICMNHITLEEKVRVAQCGSINGAWPIG